MLAEENPVPLVDDVLAPAREEPPLSAADVGMCGIEDDEAVRGSAVPVDVSRASL